MAQAAQLQYVDEGVMDGKQAVDARFHIDQILADPLHRLRYDANAFFQDNKQLNLAKSQDERQRLNYWVERLREVISEQWQDKPDRQQTYLRQLDEEYAKAQQILESGELGEVAPNPSDRYSKLLWSIALDFAQHHENANTLAESLWRSLSTSPAMEAQRQNFAARMKDSGTLTFKGKTDVPIPLYTAPGSWFGNVSKHQNPDIARSFAKLDIKISLLLGDYVDPLFHHENNHQLDSIFRPARVMRPAEEAKALREELGAIKVTDETTSLDDPAKQALLEAYLVKQYEASLVHGVWNAAEDNMVDQGVVDLVQKTANPYPYRIDIGNNVVEALVTGAGPYALGHANANKAPESAQDRLAALQWNITQAQFIRNGLTDDTPEGWTKVGVKLAAMEGGEAQYREMRELCDQIAHCKPLPDLQEMPRRYFVEAKKKCAERNVLIEKLIAEYIEPTLQEALEEFKRQDLPGKMASLRAQLNALQQGHVIPGTHQGSGQGIPLDIDLTDPPKLPPEPQQAEGEFDDLVKEAHTRRPSDDSPEDNQPPEPDRDVPDAPQQAQPTGGSAPGQGGNAIAEIELTDGRTLEELRKTALYQQAVHEVAAQLRAIAEQFPTVTTRIDPINRTDKLPEEDKVEELFDVEDYAEDEMQAEAGLGLRTGRYWRTQQEEEIGSPGDLSLMIDFSGSMSSGQGSALEAAVKSSALLYDATLEAGYGCYVSTWGHEFSTLWISPETDPEEARQAMDRLVRAAVLGEHVKGLHGGTNVEAGVADMFANLAHPRGGNAAPDAVRGPVHGMLLSDGKTFGKELQHYATALQMCPAVTLDAAYTHSNQALQQVLEAGAPQLEGWQQPIGIDISEPSQIFGNMVQWAVTRQQNLAERLTHESNHWAVSNQSIQADATQALDHFCSMHEQTQTAEKHMNNAQEQRAGLYSHTANVTTNKAGRAVA